MYFSKIIRIFALSYESYSIKGNRNGVSSLCGGMRGSAGGEYAVLPGIVAGNRGAGREVSSGADYGVAEGDDEYCRYAKCV